MKRANAISAVEGPCKVFGIETEQGFSEELIDKLCPSGNEIELTYLQIYLDRIFRIAVDEKKEGAPSCIFKRVADQSQAVFLTCSDSSLMNRSEKWIIRIQEWLS